VKWLDSVRTLDRLSGTWLNLEVPVFTADPHSVSGSGTYSADDWSHTRRKDDLQAEESAEQTWVKNLVSAGLPNFNAASDLVDAYDLPSFFPEGRTGFLEVGAGAMGQARLLRDTYPQQPYCATDFDPYVVERAKQNQLLNDIEKHVLDVSTVTPQELKKYGLVLSWVMEYALTLEQLADFLRRLGEAKTPYLMLTPSVVGLISWTRYRVQLPNLEKKLHDRKIRQHGWYRSKGLYTKLANDAGLTLRPLGTFGIYQALLFQPR